MKTSPIKQYPQKDIEQFDSEKRESNKTNIRLSDFTMNLAYSYAKNNNITFSEAVRRLIFIGGMLEDYPLDKEKEDLYHTAEVMDKRGNFTFR